MARLTLKPARPAYSVPTFTFTDMALGYSVDELDDLTSRKVEGEGIDGDRLAQIIRARRGAARATGQADPYVTRATDAVRSVWGSFRGAHLGADTRRMAAVGQIDPAWGTLGWGESYASESGDVFRWYPLDNDGGPTIVRGPNY